MLNVMLFVRAAAPFVLAGILMAVICAGREKRNNKTVPSRHRFQRMEQSFAEFAAEAANKRESIFCRGVYLAENTSQAASVEFVRLRRTNYARSRLQILSKSP